MPKARKQQISLDATPFYHCVSRCVRRAFLCGRDESSGYCFEHRRAWIEERVLQLARIFAIDVCAYAVMSNHYHLVLHINAADANSWSDFEVCRRWHQLYKGSCLTEKYLRNEALSTSEIDVVKNLIHQWRSRLADISWFMRNINEPIARKANNEDSCTGRFWEGRFKSQALLDEKALIACLAYVDLNPVRAGRAATPELSDHTSIQRRLRGFSAHCSNADNALYPFVGDASELPAKGLPFELRDYVELVDWTGRMLRDGSGSISRNLPPILERMAMDSKQWIYLAKNFESRFKILVGCAFTVRRVAAKLGYRRTPGLREIQSAFG